MGTVVETAKEGLMYEILYVDDLVLMSDTMEKLKEKFHKWKGKFESKGLKVNLGKTKVMISGTEGGIVRSRIDPCSICGRRVMTNSVLCTCCGKWVHGRCAKVKRVTAGLAQNFVCARCLANENTETELVEELCDDVETVGGFRYLGDRLSAGGGCETAVTARFDVDGKNSENVVKCYWERNFL